MKRKTFYLFAAMVALLASSCGNSGKPAFGDNEFPVMTIGTQGTELTSTYPASLKGVQDVEIRPKVSGFITKVAVQEGQHVSRGQVLFTLDSETYVAAVRSAQAAVRQAEASVSSAQAQLATARLTYTNSQSLYKNNVIGSYELQTAKNSLNTSEAAVAQAQAAVASAKASLANAKEQLSYCYVTAPTSGVVGSIPFKQGALVSPSITQPLTTISNSSTVEVYFSMTEKDILAMTKTSGNVANAIKALPAVKLKLADGTIYSHDGTVTKMSGVIDATTGSVSMIATFANPDMILRSGGSGQIIIPTVKSNAILIPQSSTTQVQDKVFVYKLAANNKVVYTEITVNPQNDGKNYIVTSGLKPGEKIVTNGITKLTDGMEIKRITEEQYKKKIEEAAKLGENQGSASGFADAMGGKKK